MTNSEFEQLRIDEAARAGLCGVRYPNDDPSARIVTCGKPLGHAERGHAERIEASTLDDPAEYLFGPEWTVPDTKPMEGAYLALRKRAEINELVEANNGKLQALAQQGIMVPQNDINMVRFEHMLNALFAKVFGDDENSDERLALDLKLAQRYAELLDALVPQAQSQVARSRLLEGVQGVRSMDVPPNLRMNGGRS